MRPRWPDGVCRYCERKHRGKEIFCRACQGELKAQLNLWSQLQKIQRDMAAIDKVLKKARGLT